MLLVCSRLLCFLQLVSRPHSTCSTCQRAPGEPIDLHQTITVMRVMMTASVESGYNLFGKVEMTFNVQGTTNLQEMIFFFKYADESDTTAYRCLTRPEKTNSTVPITCTFVSVPTSGVMRMCSDRKCEQLGVSVDGY